MRYSLCLAVLAMLLAPAVALADHPRFDRGHRHHHFDRGRKSSFSVSVGFHTGRHVTHSRFSTFRTVHHPRVHVPSRVVVHPHPVVIHRPAPVVIHHPAPVICHPAPTYYYSPAPVYAPAPTYYSDSRFYYRYSR